MSVVLAINVGSSSVKAALFEGSTESIAELGRIVVNGPRRLEEIKSWLDDSRHATPDVISHRVVHGGQRFSSSVLIDDNVIEELQALVPLAPLHLPPAIAEIAASRTLFPNAIQVASFDTAFHSTLPRIAYDLALPASLADDGVRRYGFHGLSCEHVVATEGASLGRAIVAHLGNGSSLTAVRDGKSIDTTMAFTPNSGIPMGTRSGDIDPGVLFYLLRQGRRIDEVDDIVQHHSGLSAWSHGISDMQTLQTSDSDDAKFAIEAFCTHVAKAAAGLVVSLGGLDTFIFTGGIGENNLAVQMRVLELMSPLGSFSARVVQANEELVLARHALQLI